MRTAVVYQFEPASSIVRRFAPDMSEPVLGRAATALVVNHGILNPGTLAAVWRAAASAPLDARPYLILGHQQLLDRQPERALATFAAGQRLDPRNSLLHLLLLDRDLRTGRIAEAAVQMAMLARLVGPAQAPIAAAMAQMTLAPQTRSAARRVLATDPALESGVLATLARADTPPAAIFAVASPAARAAAGAQDGWGHILVNRLVEQRRFAGARAVWQQIYGLGTATPPIFNAEFRSTPASAPFEWTFATGGLGATDARGGALTIDYYGRDSGDLASQLLVLAPGRYRFSVTVDPGKTDAAAPLFWSLGCRAGDTGLMNLALIAGPTARRLAADLVVPADCPAQWLALRGEAGDLPTSTSVTVRNPEIHPGGINP